VVWFPIDQVDVVGVRCSRARVAVPEKQAVIRGTCVNHKEPNGERVVVMQTNGNLDLRAI
jgi:hypothetical protein